MADYKPPEVHTCKVKDCVPIHPGSNHWFEPHMPCWICNADPHNKRNEMLWNEHCEMYFHLSCLEERENANA